MSPASCAYEITCETLALLLSGSLNRSRSDWSVMWLLITHRSAER